MSDINKPRLTYSFSDLASHFELSNSPPPWFFSRALRKSAVNVKPPPALQGKALAQRALRKDPCSTLNKLSKLSVKQRKCSREGLGDASAASASSAAAAPGNHARLPSCPSEPGPRELPSAPATNGRSQRQRPARQDPRQTPIATRSAVAICRSMLRVKPQQTDAAYNQHSRRIMSIVA